MLKGWVIFNFFFTYLLSLYHLCLLFHLVFTIFVFFKVLWTLAGYQLVGQLIRLTLYFIFFDFIIDFTHITPINYFLGDVINYMMLLRLLDHGTFLAIPDWRQGILASSFILIDLLINALLRSSLTFFVLFILVLKRIWLFVLHLFFFDTQ